MIKLTFCLKRLPGLALGEFQAHWRDRHAPMVRERAGVLKIRRYVQNHALPDQENSWIRIARGAPAPFDGVAELWWDSMADVTNNDPVAVAAGAELLEDERRFIDLASSPLFFSDANEVIPFAERLS